MAVRIYFRKITKGKFLNGKEKLSVAFGEDRQEDKYEWWPRWNEEVIRLFEEATKTESINSPSSNYLNAFAEVAKKTLEKVPFEKSYLRIGLILGMERNKILVSNPGFINDYGLYNSDITRITKKEEFPVGFMPTPEFNKFLGKQVVLWIINGVVMKVSETLD